MRVAWFDRWTAQVDDAARELPFPKLCPADLYRRMLEAGSREHKRIALVTDGDSPVALFGYRIARYWQHVTPITAWIVPGFVFPTAVDDLAPVLKALSLPIRVPMWRTSIPAPTGREFRAEIEDTHGFSCSEDFEKYWKESSRWRAVRRARNQCKGFELKVNPPGGSEWVVRQSEKIWRSDPERETLDLPERLVAAAYLEECGLLVSFLLFDGETPVAGCTMLDHDRVLVGQNTYRDRSYDKRQVSNRLMDLTFHWAAENRFNAIDIGGGYYYKRGWAPVAGKKAQVTYTPVRARLAHSITEPLGWAVQALPGGVGRNVKRKVKQLVVG